MSKITYFPHQGIDGRWHTVYRVPATLALSSVMDSPCKRAAEIESERLNKLQAVPSDVEPADRRIPSGFYTDVCSS